MIYAERKRLIKQHADMVAAQRDHWIDKNSYYYNSDYAYMRFLVPEGARILDIGCGTGRLLAELRPSYGLGIDLSESMVTIARDNHPDLHFEVGDVEDTAFMRSRDGPFDVIVLSDTIGFLSDCQAALANLQPLCTPDTRIIIAYYSKAWEPVLRAASAIGARMPQPELNWLSPEDIENLLHLSGFELIKHEWRQLLPKRALGLGTILNRYVAPWPGIRRLCLRTYTVARLAPSSLFRKTSPSATVLIPCKNERGNIQAAIDRIPDFCDDMEILFVEGGSTDGTQEEIARVIDAYPEKDIKSLTQSGKGKGDAVRLGFEHARGEVLMILDADLTMPPEDLPKYYAALTSGLGEFINGSRMIYPMDADAMRFLNYLANKFFSWLFTWLLNQRFTDTLCGTKVLWKRDYELISKNRSYFGEFDPFGDFDLIFGAVKLNKKVQEIPVRYAGRAYGETQISRFRHGWLLLRMVVFAYRKLKAF